MVVEHITSKNFDKSLGKLLKTKKAENVVKGRFDLEPIELTKKSSFIIDFLSSIKSIKNLTYKILFWEKDSLIENLIKLNSSRDDSFKITLSYRNGQPSGVAFLESEKIDEHFLKVLLDNHFNFEMAVDPSLNLRVQICINQKNIITVMDIYDDRGFDIYYI